MTPSRLAHLIDAHWSGFGERRSFPSIAICPRCSGMGGWSRPWRVMPSMNEWGPEYEYVDCPECSGERVKFSPDCKAVKRYTIPQRNAA